MYYLTFDLNSKLSLLRYNIYPEVFREPLNISSEDIMYYIDVEKYQLENNYYIYLTEEDTEIILNFFPEFFI